LTNLKVEMKNPGNAIKFEMVVSQTGNYLASFYFMS